MQFFGQLTSHPRDKGLRIVPGFGGMVATVMVGMVANQTKHHSGGGKGPAAKEPSQKEDIKGPRSPGQPRKQVPGPQTWPHVGLCLAHLHSGSKLSASLV